MEEAARSVLGRKPVRAKSEVVRATVASAIAVFFATGCASTIRQTVTCRAASGWLAEIEEVADPKHGLTDGERMLVERVRRSPGEKVDCLIPLLESERKDVRELAAHALSEVDGLEPRHVKPVLRAARREESPDALPWVLARIESPDAVAGLLALLRENPKSSSLIGAVLSDAAEYDVLRLRGVGEDWAYPGLGDHVISALIELLESRRPGDEASQQVAIAILATAGPETDEMATLFMRLATDPERPLETRKSGIVAIVLSPHRDVARDSLQELLQSDSPDLAIAASSALFVIEGPRPNTPYSRALAPFERSRPESMDSSQRPMEFIGSIELFQAMTKIWQSGVKARAAAPTMIRLLAPDAWPDVRAQAAWTLGFLGASEAGPALTSILDDADWLLVSAAADSLGRLRFRLASDRLADLAKRHWYPPVRSVASRAIAAIDGSYSHPPISSDGVSSILPTGRYDIHALPGPIPESCVRSREDPMALRRDDHFDRGTNLDEAKRHAYLVDDAWTFGNERSRLEVVPDVGVRVTNGWLLAQDRGEFGGELVFESEGGAIQLVARGNFQDIHSFDDGRKIAIEGLAHMGADRGDLFEVRERADGWTVEWWRRLPGAPEASWTRADGTLLVDTTRGSVVVHPDGRMEQDSCTRMPLADGFEIKTDSGE